MRHDVEVAGSHVTFFSLLAHLGQQSVSSQSQIPWIRELVRVGDKEALRSLVKGEVALFDLPVEAGDVVGTVGWVRRGPEWGPEVHFEIFSAERPPEVIARTFNFLGAAADGLMVARGGVLAFVDENSDGQVTLEELRHFFREGDPEQKQGLRQVAIRHVHEWGDRLADARESAGPLRERRRARICSACATRPPRRTSSGMHACQRTPDCPSVRPSIRFTPSPSWGPALAAASHGLTMHWPARTPVGLEDATPGPPDLSQWSTPREVAEESRPIFGPVVGAESRIPKKSEIPLIMLP